MLVDSNILIYASHRDRADLRSWLLDTLPRVSVISRVEILGYHRLQAAEESALEELLDCLELIYPTSATFEIAIRLRQQQRLSLGDAMIAATCIEHGLKLATHNVADFLNIEGLLLIDPVADQ